MRLKYFAKIAISGSICCLLYVGAATAQTTPAAVLANYADIGQAMYEDAHRASADLQRAVDALIEAPSEETLRGARMAWIDARPWYMHTEAYRFGNPIVDEWEGNVNAWPLDEGLIDYVDPASYGEASDENPLRAANVIANTSLRLGRDVVDTSTITPELLRDKLHAAMGADSNVALGWHALEFLLWGQDLNGTGPGSGARPWTDFSTTECTNGHCDRRATYLKVATDTLVQDLADMAAWWAPGGQARADFEARDAKAGIATILTGLINLSFGELAGDRIKVGLMLHDPEEEHDCFSDDTHHSYFNAERGMDAVWHGTFVRRDGSTVTGPSIALLLAETDAASGTTVEDSISQTLASFAAIEEEADKPGGEHWDQLIGVNNPKGAMIQAVVDSLVAQTRAFEGASAQLGVAMTAEANDSLAGAI